MNNVNIILFALVAILILAYFSSQITEYYKIAYGFLSSRIKVKPAEKSGESAGPSETMLVTSEQQTKIELKKFGGGKVIFDQSHENMFAAFGVDGTYSKFAGKFVEAGYEFETINDAENFTDKIKEARILIIAKPLTGYSKEKEKIFELVRDGVSLILIGDTDRTAIGNLNELAVPTGINFNRDFLYDLHENLKLFSYIFIKDFRNHNVTQNLNKIVLYDSCSIDTFDKAKALAFTSSTTRSNFGLRNLTTLAVSDYGKGSVFAICDGDIWTNEKLNQADNENLLINLINWLQTK